MSDPEHPYGADFDPGNPTAGIRRVRRMDLEPGHVIISGGQFGRITEHLVHQPGRHPEGSPITKDTVAHELRTTTGTRWFGENASYARQETMVYHPMWEGHEARPFPLKGSRGGEE
jgi:hypothetical protein